MAVMNDIKKWLLILFIVVSFAGILQAALPVQTTFMGAKSERTWPLSELNSNLPADWTGSKFLVIEFKASSSQRFKLGLDTANGCYTKRIGPFAGVWTRAVIPLRFYSGPAGNAADLAATFNQPRESYWINIDGGGYGPLTNVTGLTVLMNNAVGTPTLDIRSITLATDSPGDAVLEGKPLIDEFGQYTHAQWPGKAYSLKDLKAVWAAEETALETPLTNRDSYGGFLNTQAKVTGFFYVKKIHGQWWFVGPDGHLFFSSGINGVTVTSITHVKGREDLFAALPPRNLVPLGPGAASFYVWNLQRRFGDDWPAKWADLTTRRMAAWGFNTMQNWGRANPVEPRVPYALMMRDWQAGDSIMGLPDVYADNFASRVDQIAAGQLDSRKNDPYMLGYFIGNEPSWPGHESLLCDRVLAGPPTATQTRLKVFLANGDTPTRRKEFVLAAFKVYVDTINAATHRHDPHHLNLGMRFGEGANSDIVKITRHFDVFSLNDYSDAPSRAMLDRIYSLTKRPILIGEFHFGTPERGMSEGLVPTMNQVERAAGYRYYVEQSAADPAVVGVHWFQWLDEPVSGRNDGENYNIGFVDVTDQPYPEMVASAKLMNEHLLDIHSGKIPPTERKPKAFENAFSH
jgi:hypothetical protein